MHHFPNHWSLIFKSTQRDRPSECPVCYLINKPSDKSCFYCYQQSRIRDIQRQRRISFHLACADVWSNLSLSQPRLPLSLCEEKVVSSFQDARRAFLFTDGPWAAHTDQNSRTQALTFLVSITSQSTSTDMSHIKYLGPDDTLTTRYPRGVIPTPASLHMLTVFRALHLLVAKADVLRLEDLSVGRFAADDNIQLVNGLHHSPEVTQDNRQIRRMRTGR